MICLIDSVELERLYHQENMSLAAIARRYGVSHTTVLRRMQRLGIPRRPYRSKGKEPLYLPLDMLRCLYCDERLSLRAIAQRYGCSRETIRVRLRDMGVQRHLRCAECGLLIDSGKLCDYCMEEGIT